MMERTLNWVRGYAGIAWWDGSCLDLRLHRLTDLIDVLAGVPEAEPTLVPAHWRERFGRERFGLGRGDIA